MNTIIRMLATLLVVTIGGSAQAQLPGIPGGFGQPARPAVSPYLNLLRGGNPAYLNYYGLVRPQQQAMAAENQILNQIGTTNRALSGLTQDINTAINPEQFSTGTGFGFMTHRQYFMTAGSFNSLGAPGMSGGGRGGVGIGMGAGGRGGMGMGAGGRGGMGMGAGGRR